MHPHAQQNEILSMRRVSLDIIDTVPFSSLELDFSVDFFFQCFFEGLKIRERSVSFSVRHYPRTFMKQKDAKENIRL